MAPGEAKYHCVKCVRVYILVHKGNCVFMLLFWGGGNGLKPLILMIAKIHNAARVFSELKTSPGYISQTPLAAPLPQRRMGGI